MSDCNDIPPERKPLPSAEIVKALDLPICPGCKILGYRRQDCQICKGNGVFDPELLKDDEQICPFCKGSDSKCSGCDGSGYMTTKLD